MRCLHPINSLLFAALALGAGACGSDGVTTHCEPMPQFDVREDDAGALRGDLDPDCVTPLGNPRASTSSSGGAGGAGGEAGN